MLVAATGTVALVGGWPVFVFTGSQIAYLVAAVGAAMIAAPLAWARSPLITGYLLGVVAIVGPDVNGELGTGRALLGSLRLIDTTVAVAALAVACPHVRSVWRGRTLSRPGGLAIVAALAIVYATIRWLMKGHPVDALTRTDVRLILVTALVAYIVRRCQRGSLRIVLWSVLIVGILTAIKAIVIHFSGLVAVGSYDRLQANSFWQVGHLRTILVGGDTLLILVPGVALVLGEACTDAKRRAIATISALLCLAALALSATRTSILVALGVIAIEALLLLLLRRPRLSVRSSLIALVLALLAVGAAASGGVASRLVHSDSAGSGLSFRANETRSFLALSTVDDVFGQGFGGRFLSEDTADQPVLSAWAHELPVWLALKDGVFGLVCAVLALALLFRRGLAASRSRAGRVQLLAGVGIVCGLLTMSLTTDRIALIDGAVPFVVGVLLISAGAPDTEHTGVRERSATLAGGDFRSPISTRATSGID